MLEQSGSGGPDSPDYGSLMLIELTTATILVVSLVGIFTCINTRLKRRIGIHSKKAMRPSPFCCLPCRAKPARAASRNRKKRQEIELEAYVEACSVLKPCASLPFAGTATAYGEYAIPADCIELNSDGAVVENDVTSWGFQAADEGFRPNPSVRTVDIEVPTSEDGYTAVTIVPTRSPYEEVSLPSLEGDGRSEVNDTQARLKPVPRSDHSKAQYNVLNHIALDRNGSLRSASNSPAPPCKSYQHIVTKPADGAVNAYDYTIVAEGTARVFIIGESYDKLCPDTASCSGFNHTL